MKGGGAPPRLELGTTPPQPDHRQRAVAGRGGRGRILPDPRRNGLPLHLPGHQDPNPMATREPRLTADRWRARCREVGTAGSASGPGKRTGCNTGTAPGADSTGAGGGIGIREAAARARSRRVAAGRHLRARLHRSRRCLIASAGLSAARPHRLPARPSTIDLRRMTRLRCPEWTVRLVGLRRHHRRPTRSS